LFPTLSLILFLISDRACERGFFYFDLSNDVGEAPVPEQTQLPTPARIYSVSDLCVLLGKKRHQIVYALLSYPVEPYQHAGTAKLFADYQVDAIRSALRRTEERRAGS
jgi:hypothetical protein